MKRDVSTQLLVRACRGFAIVAAILGSCVGVATAEPEEKPAAAGSGARPKAVDGASAAAGGKADGAPAKERRSQTAKGDQAAASAAAGSVKEAPPEGAGKSGAADGTVNRYCASIANPAAEARLARQKKQLEELRTVIDAKVALLDRRIGEYKDWLSRRDEFVNKVRESLVGIYSSMKTEAAAKQLAEIDEETASAVLAKLDARNASSIMAEMDAKKAARLVQLIASVGSVEAEAPNTEAPDAPASDADAQAADAQDAATDADTAEAADPPSKASPAPNAQTSPAGPQGATGAAGAAKQEKPER